MDPDSPEDGESQSGWLRPFGRRRGGEEQGPREADPPKTPPPGPEEELESSLTASADMARARLHSEVERVRSELTRVVAEEKAEQADLLAAVDAAEERLRAEIETQIDNLRKGFDTYLVGMRSELDTLRESSEERAREQALRSANLIENNTRQTRSAMQELEERLETAAKTRSERLGTALEMLRRDVEDG